MNNKNILVWKLEIIAKLTDIYENEDNNYILPDKYEIDEYRIIYSIYLNLFKLKVIKSAEMNHVPVGAVKNIRNVVLLNKRGVTIMHGSYVFMVKLASGLWRKIQINKTDTLEDLHYVILDAYDFDDDHLYAFFMDNKPWSDKCYSSPYANYLDASSVKLYQFAFKPNDEFLYIYDFGDSWHFSISVCEVLDVTVEKPNVIQKKGRAPKQYN